MHVGKQNMGCYRPCTCAFTLAVPPCVHRRVCHHTRACVQGKLSARPCTRTCVCASVQMCARVCKDTHMCVHVKIPTFDTESRLSREPARPQCGRGARCLRGQREDLELSQQMRRQPDACPLTDAGPWLLGLFLRRLPSPVPPAASLPRGCPGGLPAGSCLRSLNSFFRVGVDGCDLLSDSVFMHLKVL